MYSILHQFVDIMNYRKDLVLTLRKHSQQRLVSGRSIKRTINYPNRKFSKIKIKLGQYHIKYPNNNSTSPWIYIDEIGIQQLIFCFPSLAAILWGSFIQDTQIVTDIFHGVPQLSTKIHSGPQWAGSDFFLQPSMNI